MTSKKLGALLRSVPPATARAEASGDLSASIIAPEPAALPRAARPAAMEPEVPLQVLIPKHVRTQLGVRAAEEGRSLRELVPASHSETRNRGERSGHSGQAGPQSINLLIHDFMS